jgi:hypothetical protein
MKRGALFVKKENLLSRDSSKTPTQSTATDDVQANWQHVVRRRSFLQGIGMAGATVLPAGKVFAQEGNRLSNSDAALLRFAARRSSLSRLTFGSNTTSSADRSITMTIRIPGTLPT